jgi:hypothetical protein
MKIFISWSGDLSKAVAVAYRDWLKLVIHGADAFVSEEDIDKGTRALARIAEELEGTDCGILCITRRNIDRPWVNYEAGALSKKVGDARVMPFLVDLQHGDIPQHNPLSQFQTTANSKADILRMIKSINRSVTPPVTEEAVVERLFDAVWQDIEGPIQQALANSEEGDETATNSPGRIGAQVSELLDLVRSQQREISALRSDVRFFTYERRSSTRMEELLSSAPNWGLRPRQQEELVRVLAELSRQLGRPATTEDFMDWMNETAKTLIEVTGLSGQSSLTEGPLADKGE